MQYQEKRRHLRVAQLIAGSLLGRITHNPEAGDHTSRLAAAPVGADMLNPAKAKAFIRVHKDTSSHAVSSHEEK